MPPSPSSVSPLIDTLLPTPAFLSANSPLPPSTPRVSPLTMPAKVAEAVSSVASRLPSYTLLAAVMPPMLAIVARSMFAVVDAVALASV